MECLNCGLEIVQTPKKKQKIFCNSTCRSNYWQKSERLSNQGLTEEQIVASIKKTWKPKKNAKEEPTKENPKVKNDINNFWKERMAKKLGIK